MKRRNSHMAVATALAASVLVLAGCGGGSGEETAEAPAPNPTPATPPPASPPPASPPPASPPPASPPPASPPPASPPPATNTIPLNSTYGPNTNQTCTLGDDDAPPAMVVTTGMTISYAANTLTLTDPLNPPAVDVAFNAPTPAGANPTGTDDTPSTPSSAPLSATYTGKATVGSDPYVLTLSISADNQLLGVLYNPDPVDNSQSEIDRIEDARVRCGNQIQ